ncbi:M-phase inducer phosphatase 1-A-like [Ambystoma mexicanum]|uniref:M-phase inducer phosphatase 1-A-like n=1 Tax=Ambystoma mexicanum TaxID=8296 RepID=UPI0037E90F6D
MESPEETGYGDWSDRRSSENSLDEVLTFSPDLGLSPVMSLSHTMGYLTCRDKVTPRRRLKLSPDSQSPSPSDSACHPAATETPTLTGLSVESSSVSKNRTRNISRRPSESSISKSQKGFRMKLTHLFRSPEPHLGVGSENQPLYKKKPILCERRHDSRRGSSHRPETQALLPVRDSIQQMTETDIEDENLIGDFSKPYCLPVEPGKHQDLKYISSDTVAALLIGKYSRVVEEYALIDCRYPYEYAGGHIKGALNLYREEHLIKTFLQDPQSRLPVHRRILLIFHCEFSSERGPKLCRTLRKLDRNANSYPNLCFPELYVLKGGYKEFYECFKGLCEPQAYVHMLHTDFRDELRKFHQKNKSWTTQRIRKELFKPQNS